MRQQIGTLNFETESFPSCCGMSIVCNFTRAVAREAKTKTTVNLRGQWERICKEEAVNKLAATTTTRAVSINKALIKGGWIQEGNEVENPNTGNMLILWTFTTSDIETYSQYDNGEEE